MGEYQGSILFLDDGSGNTVTFYTTDVDANPAPGGKVDDSLLGTDGTLGALVDMNFTALRGDFYLGGDTLSSIVLWDNTTTVIDTNIYDSDSNVFQYGWTTDLPNNTGGGGGPMAVCWDKQRSNLAEQKNTPSTEFVPVQLETTMTTIN